MGPTLPLRCYKELGVVQPALDSAHSCLHHGGGRKKNRRVREHHGVHSSPFLRSILMATGIVKWFNPTKGYGFIQPDQGGADVFVHITALEAAGLRSLNEGQKVSYELATNKGKTSAANLKIAA